MDFGGRLGGVNNAGKSSFRGAMHLELGLDVRIAKGDPHPVLALRYRFEPLRSPDIGAQHLVLLGVNLRTAEGRE